VDHNLQQEHEFDKIAEAALRNLHLDCFLRDEDTTQFSSRMLHLGADGLVIERPHHQGQALQVSDGDRVVCSCRLGQEILRFHAVVAEHVWFRLNQQAGIPAVLLCELSEPRLVQRRRYFRLALTNRRPADVTCWLVMTEESGAVRVCSKFDGKIVDLSTGGIGVLIEDESLLVDTTDRQLWVRFSLPNENESLIFRVELRHMQGGTGQGDCRIGLEFMEYVEPGREQAIVEKLAEFVMHHELA